MPAPPANNKQDPAVPVVPGAWSPRAFGTDRWRLSKMLAWLRSGHEAFSGYLKAVWPDFWGCVFEVWGPGAGQTSEMHPNKSGQTAFRHPDFSFTAAALGLDFPRLPVQGHKLASSGSNRSAELQRRTTYKVSPFWEGSLRILGFGVPSMPNPWFSALFPTPLALF